MEFKGTKGVWLSEHNRVFRDESKSKTICVCQLQNFRHDKRGRIIKETEHIENAKLIAAAPDLLKALQSMKYQINQWKKQDPETLGYKWAIQAENAIKKALKQ